MTPARVETRFARHKSNALATEPLLKGGEPLCNEPGKDLCENLCIVAAEPALQRERRSKSLSPVSKGLSTVTGDVLES